MNTQNVRQVHHYHNVNFASGLLEPSNPTIGLSNSRISVSDGNLTCTVSRDNSNPNPRYFDFNAAAPYVAYAYGNLPANQQSL